MQLLKNISLQRRNNITSFNLYTVSQKKTNTLDFVHNFGKCRPIYKILSLSDSWGNFVHIHHKDSPPDLKYVSALPCETWNLNDILHVRPQNSSCKIWGRLNSLGVNPVTIKSGKQCSSAYKLQEDQWCQRTEAVDDWHVTWAAADNHWWNSHQ